MFSIAEREYLQKHIGRKPSVLEEEPPPRGVNHAGMAVALQRFWGEEGRYDAIRQAITLSLKGEKLKKEERQLHGGAINYKAIGVGLGRGQTSHQKMFSVPLSARSMPTKENYFADLMTEEEAAKVVVDPEAVRLAEQIECPFCDVVKSGSKALQAIDAHARRQHPDHLDEWNERKARLKEIRANAA
jgi:hypothetical protein